MDDKPGTSSDPLGAVGGNVVVQNEEEEEEEDEDEEEEEEEEDDDADVDVDEEEYLRQINKQGKVS